MKKLKDLDCIFLSYDEDNAEYNWLYLKNRVGYAKRLHRVKGFDKAHKIAASMSDTENFILIDGDTQMNDDFIDGNEIDDLDKNHAFYVTMKHNGLITGSGALKVLNKSYVLTHDNFESVPEDDVNANDFTEYNWVIHNNQSYGCSDLLGNPFQAFRSGCRLGYREIKYYHVNDVHKTFCNYLACVFNEYDFLERFFAIGFRIGALFSITRKLPEQSINDFEDYKPIFEEYRMMDKMNELMNEIDSLNKKLKDLGYNFDLIPYFEKKLYLDKFRDILCHDGYSK